MGRYAAPKVHCVTVYFRLGDASVMAVFVFASLLLVTLLQWRLFRRQVEY